MYFDFEDYHPDISPVGRAISWREGILLSVIVHMAGIIIVLLYPRLCPYDPSKARAVVRLAPQTPNTMFVFAQPKLDRKALTAPPNASPSDMDRQAQAREKPPPKPENNQPFSRGNTPELAPTTPLRQPPAPGPRPPPAPPPPRQPQNPP